MALNASKIKEIVDQLGFDFKEKRGTIYTTCPGCGESDKLSILKKPGPGCGSTVCYRGSCSFGGPRPFFEWVMLSAGITREKAIEMVYAEPVQPAQQNGLKINLAPTKAEKQIDPLVPILWPMPDLVGWDAPESLEGAQYLASRGITFAVAHEAGIRYSPFTRRVVIPIKMNGMIYGWQARAIDQVAPGDRMRNPPGFQRARCVMFLDNVKPGGPAIIAEGPFDAMKFWSCGGAVSTIGKVVSQEQIDLIIARKPSAIYLALDDDAAPEMRALSNLPVPVFRITVPEAAAQRCQAQRKKADFGECTFEECKLAFDCAQPFNKLSTPIYLKNPFEKLKR